jgi:catechol 2,3-dioxygenase-like lactoylglutathione lyase family enzyme
VSGFGHVDLRVSDLPSALPFYESLMPSLGFTVRYHGEAWKVWAQTEPGLPATAYFGITESRAHVPNDNRIAFWVSSAAEVDRLADVVRSAGAVDVSGPSEMPYGPGYYALYFDDPSGNRFEIYHRPG